MCCHVAGSLLGLSVPLQTVDSPADATGVFAAALPVLPLTLPSGVDPGRPDAINAPAVTGSIERAVALVRSGEAAAIVTNPVHKGILYEAGFRPLFRDGSYLEIEVTHVNERLRWSRYVVLGGD